MGGPKFFGKPFGYCIYYKVLSTLIGDRMRDGWREVFLEDVGVCEGMQQGRESAAFDGGAFSPVRLPAATFYGLPRVRSLRLGVS